MEHDDTFWVETGGINGPDAYTVEQCSECDGAVIRHFSPKSSTPQSDADLDLLQTNPDAYIKKLKRNATTPIRITSTDPEHVEPDHLIDIPRSAIPWLIEQLQALLAIPVDDESEDD